jgi:hypothetical protein
MACCPLLYHCLICHRMTSTENLRSAMVSDRRAAQAGTKKFRGATDPRNCRTTATSPPRGIGVWSLSGSKVSQCKGLLWVLSFVSRRRGPAFRLVAIHPLTYLCSFGSVARGFSNLLAFLRLVVFFRVSWVFFFAFSILLLYR